MAGLQPPARSWFRLASIARMEAAEAAAAASSTARSSATPSTPPLPRPLPIPRPQQQPNSSPPPPPPPPPPPQPEIKAPIATEAASPTPPRVATPPESPKVIKPSFSSPPPSPTVLKQANNTHNPEPEPETKPLPPPLFQTSSALTEEKSITDSNGNRASKQGPLTKEDKKLRVITMAGDNTGAVMDIGSAAQRRLGGKMEREDEDGKKGGKGAAKMKHMEAVVNSNVQGINNSIVLNSTTTQHSPGVHITFASNRKPKGSGSYEGRHKANHSDQV